MAYIIETHNKYAASVSRFIDVFKYDTVEDKGDWEWFRNTKKEKHQERWGLRKEGIVYSVLKTDNYQTFKSPKACSSFIIEYIKKYKIYKNRDELLEIIEYIKEYPKIHEYVRVKFVEYLI